MPIPHRNTSACDMLSIRMHHIAKRYGVHAAIVVDDDGNQLGIGFFRIEDELLTGEPEIISSDVIEKLWEDWDGQQLDRITEEAAVKVAQGATA